MFTDATYCSYDIHGNVDTLVQDFGYGQSGGVLNAMNTSGNRFKKIVYNYDLISGKVNQVSYQPGQPDAYYHKYSYDAENRLTDVYTGRDSTMLLLFPEREAHYSYYKHGPLMQTILGQLQVQKQDYAYTLQGWLKGINPTMGGTLTNGTDTTEAFPVTQDVYGFSLHYYKNDYRAIGYSPQSTSVLGALTTNAAPLYNGNIAAMTVNIPQLSATKVYNYHYDQLNRIVAMDMYNGLNPNTGTFTPVSDTSYKERISYDPNGNILKYLRNGDAGNTMDSLNYKYYSATNKLSQVTDNVPANKYTTDIDNQVANNYNYDAIGNMISATSDTITNITWNVYGKIAAITKNAKQIKYTYDASGNRIMKQTANDTTVYVRDATGNVMSVYYKPAGGSLIQSEMHLYGSSRLGIATQHLAPDTSVILTGGFAKGIKSIFTRGEKFFELSNHLGNVLATVTDRRIQVDANSDGTVDSYKADIESANDYYPFGMLMPGRKYSVANTNYRYGFNGKELDREISGTTTYDYGFRIYSPGLSRFLSVDPITKKYPELTPYQFASNIPIAGIDFDGLEFLPRFNQSDPFSLTTWAFATKARDLDNSRAGKIIHGLWNTASGTVGMTASISYMAGSDGIGAALGGVVAFNFSAGTTALGITQLTDALTYNSPKNEFLHEASNIPGLIAYGMDSKNAEAIDVFSGIVPQAFMSGNGTTLFSASNFVKSGFGAIEGIRDFAKLPSISNGLRMIDALKTVKDIAVESFQLISKVNKPVGQQAAMDEGAVLTQKLSYNISYKVASGDNLSLIAKKLGTSVDILSQQNNIENPDKIEAGQKIMFSNTIEASSR